jgi:hypothetical protein
MEGIQDLLGIYTGTQSERASLLSHIHLLGTALDDAGFVSHSAGTDVAAALRSALSLADEFTRARDSALRTSAE